MLSATVSPYAQYLCEGQSILTGRLTVIPVDGDSCQCVKDAAVCTCRQDKGPGICGLVMVSSVLCSAILRQVPMRDEHDTAHPVKATPA